MTRRREYVVFGSLGLILIVGLLTLLVLGPRWLTAPPPDAIVGDAAPIDDARKIRARLFYANTEGTGLSGVEQEVVYSEGPADQARRIIEAQLATPPAPRTSAIPPGTKLRTVFLTADGEAYVDLSSEVQANHPGGTTNEILTVYSLVSALTANLPAVTGVQILIEGKEVDTLAGHLDLRRPIEQDLRWITE